MDVETLAKELHEAGREAVEKGCVVNKTYIEVEDLGDGFTSATGRKQNINFKEWKEISEEAREGRRIQAKYLLNKYTMIKNQNFSILMRVMDSVRFEQKILMNKIDICIDCEHHRIVREGPLNDIDLILLCSKTKNTSIHSIYDDRKKLEFRTINIANSISTFKTHGFIPLWCPLLKDEEIRSFQPMG